jgi:hypothetical protein
MSLLGTLGLSPESAKAMEERWARELAKQEQANKLAESKVADFLDFINRLRALP